LTESKCSNLSIALFVLLRFMLVVGMSLPLFLRLTLLPPYFSVIGKRPIRALR
jgi:hypothetical protein